MSVRQLQDIPESLVIDVGNIQDHAQLVHPPYGFFAFGSQPSLRISRPSGGQRIFLVPGQHHGADAELFIIVIDLVNIFPNVRQSFQTHHHIDLAFFGPFLKILVFPDNV